MSDPRDEDAQHEHGEHGADAQERDADARERAEAEALAAALDGRPHAQAPPEDALEAALLMRHGGPRGELSRERSEAILSQLLSGSTGEGETRSRAATAVPAARGGRVIRLLPWAAALTAAAATLLLMVREAEGPLARAPIAVAPPPPAAVAAAPVPAAAAPAATVELLSAQSAWLRAGLERERGATGAAQRAAERAAAARFEHELRAFRALMFRDLHARYPEQHGQRVPPARKQAPPRSAGAATLEQPPPRSAGAATLEQPPPRSAGAAALQAEPALAARARGER